MCSSDLYPSSLNLFLLVTVVVVINFDLDCFTNFVFAYFHTVGKSGFVSHTKHIAEVTNMDLFHS